MMTAQKVLLILKNITCVNTMSALFRPTGPIGIDNQLAKTMTLSAVILR